MDQAPARKATRRLGARERARLQWISVLVICVLLWFVVLLPWIGSLRENRYFQTCQTNLQKIATGLKLYGEDWDTTLPPGPVWTTGALGNMGATSNTGFDVMKYLKCPKDDSTSETRYLYNDLLSGINPSLRYPKDPEKDARRKRVRNVSAFPLVIEKYGSQLNGHKALENWDDVAREMSFEHRVPDPTGILITGSGNVVRRTRAQIQELVGKRF